MILEIPEYLIPYLEVTNGSWMFENEKLIPNFIQVFDNDIPRIMEKTDRDKIILAFVLAKNKC